MDYILVAFSLPDNSKPVFSNVCLLLLLFKMMKSLVLLFSEWQSLCTKASSEPEAETGLVLINQIQNNFGQPFKPWLLSTDDRKLKHKGFNIQLTFTNYSLKLFQKVKCAVCLHNTKELIRKLIFSSGRLMNVRLEVVILTQNNTFGSKKDRLLEYRQRKQLHQDRKSKIFQIWLTSCL